MQRSLLQECERGSWEGYGLHLENTYTCREEEIRENMDLVSEEDMHGS
ncbi:hypothetical protein HU200_016685 [Digitaria exilis]|uniref:Uncharacterized protein n=1 Tax=Digitaria exilis TaxID=1010633 RepID=A0A835F7N5_9POAL|nr:hypothetical protein HU200_016685 [Digitaria exilis]